MPTGKRMIHCVFAVLLFLCFPLAAQPGQIVVKALWIHSRKELKHNHFGNGIEVPPHLRRYLLQATSASPSPSPALTSSPFPSPSPSPSPTLSPLSSPSPSPSPSGTPLSSTSTAQELPSPESSFFPFSDYTELPEASPPPTPANNDQSTDKKTIAIAVSLTALVAFALAGLFFACCTKICWESPRDRKNDEHPLLSLSLSDYSVSSSNKTLSNGNSIKEEKLKLHDEKPPMRLGHVSSTVAAFESSGTIISSLPYPPGRKPSNPMVETLPHEPPASLKQHSSVQPPAPPAPPKPPPPKIPPPRPPGKPPGIVPPRPPPPSKAKQSDADSEPNAPKAKLKPFFWDKVLANPDQSMVWHQIKSGSFQFNEEMIESLFGAAPVDKGKTEKKKDSGNDGGAQFVQILDPKKAQNLSIMLRALNIMIEEVSDALEEGNELPIEFLQMLLKMAPSQEEELKLRLYDGDAALLGPAERFLKVLVDTPFAFKRLEALLFMCSLEEEVTSTKESLSTLKTACNELRNCRLFLKVLEAVLKTGNRMNVGTFRGDAQAFKLDTLLKLSDVKGTDGKTTLLHFVVQEIVRSEGLKAARAMKENRSVSSVSSKTEDFDDDAEDSSDVDYHRLGLREVAKVSFELEHVKKAAAVDADTLSGNLSTLAQWVDKMSEFLEEMREEGGPKRERGFGEKLGRFVGNAVGDVRSLQAEEKEISALVKSTGDYFHGHAGRDEGLRLFVVIRDFLIILDRVCKEVSDTLTRQAKSLRKESSSASDSASMGRRISDRRNRLFPAIALRRAESTSDSDTDPDS